MNVENPLTLEEKVSVTGLIGHDIMSQHGMTLLQGEEDFAHYRNSHVGRVIMAISQLTQQDCHYNILGINNHLETMQGVFKADKKDLSVNINTNEKTLVGDACILYSALYNLAKNGFNAIGREEGTVTLTISEHLGGIIKNPVFIPKGAKQGGYFMKFDVHDTGEGFPKDKPLKDFLEFGVTLRSRQGGTGFGLYFATLASKYLQAPLGITSEPGNTHISLYHPVNLGKE
ncbi:hypothetical protein CEE44_05305 [Candidatus Woesearchaeota archaeon B3_Woes]|nr:MAG: hypothetical protein CEE44_05305 [Candidatus Woesearchaeota archaeon B3_Woes]